MTKILVVDDEPQLRRALTLNLEVRDYEVLETTSGEEALALIWTERPDLVLLDLGLPGIDGMTVLRALRARRGLAIIVITARDDEHSRVDALEAGADDYVTKPFGMADLVERVRTVVIRRAGGGQG